MLPQIFRTTSIWYIHITISQLLVSLSLIFFISLIFSPLPFLSNCSSKNKIYPIQTFLPCKQVLIYWIEILNTWLPLLWLHYHTNHFYKFYKSMDLCGIENSHSLIFWNEVPYLGLAWRRRASSSSPLDFFRSTGIFKLIAKKS